MDPFGLDLNPAMSSSLFYNHSSSNDSINFAESNDFPSFPKQNSEETLAENYNKISSPSSPDNKGDIISESDNDLNINNVDEFIIYFQENFLNECYFKKDFDGIIYQIEKKFPYFFNDKNSGLLYLIEKLRFFNLLIEKKIEEARKFYQEKLIILIKEVKKQNWEVKSKFFIKLIKHPRLVEKQGDLQKKYYDQFTYEVEKAIRNFLPEENEIEENQKSEFMNSNSNNYNINLYSSSSFDFENYKMEKNFKSKDSLNFKEIKDEEDEKKNANDEKDDELDLDNFSTKEEFSDFEDELQPKIVNDTENQKNKEAKDYNENKINLNSFANMDNDEEFFSGDPVNNNSPFFSNSSMSSSSLKNLLKFPKETNFAHNEEELIINTTLNKNGKCNKKGKNIEEKTTITSKKSNKDHINNKPNKKGKNKNEETIFNQLPFLNSFKPKYIKRETIDKKIIRTFKNFVVKEYKEKRLEINDKTMDQNFFISFVSGNVLPPIEYLDGVTGEYIKFSSFNCSYLLWFFSKKGVKDIYTNFIDKKGKEFVDSIGEHYEISPEEKAQLNYYIMNFPFIFDISLVNNITQGAEVTHLYRTVEKNKKLQKNRRKRRENDLDLQRNKSGNSTDLENERNRSREFENDDE